MQGCGTGDALNPVASACRAGEVYRIRARAASGATSYVFFDRLQREVRGVSKAFNANAWATAITTYNAAGNKYTVARPGGSGTITTTYLYDVLNRITTETTTGNNGLSISTTATTTYSGLTTAVSRTNAGGTGPQASVRVVNSQGKTVQTKASTSGSTFATTRYVYEPFGELIQTTGPTGIVVRLGYDRRGRKISMTDADVGYDATAGITRDWQYVYNGASELIWERDAKGQETRFVYDALGRTSARREYPGVETGARFFGTSWGYDAPCANGVGKLCSVATTESRADLRATIPVSMVNDYDAQGRLAIVTKSLEGRSWQSGSAYDALGRAEFVGYPSLLGGQPGYWVKQRYTAWSGQVDRVEDPSGNRLWEATSRMSDGLIQSQYVGNVAVTSGYDPLARPKSIAAGTAINASYTFDALGNVTQRSDSAAGLTAENYTYDYLNRLTQSTGPAGPKTQSYDDAGSFQTKSDVSGTYAYTPGTHRVTGAGGQSYAYDANGSLLTGAGRTISWSTFLAPEHVTGSGQTLDYWYGADHQRVIEVSSATGKTTYLGQQFAELAESGSTHTLRHYVATPEGIAAVVVADLAAPRVPTAATRYWLKDHLGSVAVTMDAAGGNVQRMSFDAWGKRRNANGTDATFTLAQLLLLTTQRGYTGHESLDEVGLVHMNGRLYDPVLGRFVSADPVIQAPYDGQSYNRYAYVLNNPLAFTDPTGFSWWTKWRKTVFAIAAAVVAPYLAEVIMVAYAEAAGSTLFVELGPGLSVTGLNTAGSAVAAAAGGFAAGGISGGNLQSAVQGALFASLNFGIGEVTGHGALAFGSSEYAANAGMHAVVGCAQQAAAGGSCRAGALSAGFSALAGPMPGANGLAQRVIIGAIASRIAGDKAQNGALTAAFDYLFNECVRDACKRFLRERGFEPVSSESGGVQTMVDYSDRPAVPRPTTMSPREVWSGTINEEDWFNVDVSPLAQRVTQMPIELKFGIGTEFGARLYQYEEGLGIYQQYFVGGQLISERQVGAIWGLGYVWRTNPADGPISRTRFRTCSFADLCIGGP